MGLMQRYAFNGSSKYCSVNRPGYVTLALLPGITHALQGRVAPGGKEIPVAWRSGQWGRFFPLRAGDTAILQVTPEATGELPLRQAGGTRVNVSARTGY